LEQIGSVVTVNFSEGTTLVGQPYRVPTSLDGAQVTLKSNAPAKPTLQVLNVASTKAVVNSTAQVVRITAPVGSQVALLVAEAAMFTTNGVAFDVQPFEANSVIQVNEKTATVGASGFVDIPVTLTNTNPEGGYNHLVAAVKDAQGHTGLLSDVHVLQLETGSGGNTAPTSSGIANVTVIQNAPDTVINLFASFADAEDADEELTYSVVSNSNSGLFDAVTIDAATGKLTLDYASTATGTAQLAVKATDTGGLSATTNFSVTVTPTPTPTPITSLQLEAESAQLVGYRVENNSSASGGKLVSLVGGAKDETGSATFTFNGAEGNYDLYVAYYDENDGVARLEAFVGSTKLGEVILDQDFGSNAIGNNRVEAKIGVTALKAGDTIQIKGYENLSEHARLDYIKLVPTNSPPPTPNYLLLEAETAQLSGYRVESNSLASGGKLVSLVGGLTNETGSATFTFNGAVGNYDLYVAYYDENDGVAKLEAFIGSTKLGEVILDQDLGSDKIGNNRVEAKIGSVALKAGDTIQIKGFENLSEHARLDYIKLIPTNSPTPTPTPTPTPAPSNTSIRINSGGGQYTDTAGQVWLADQYFTGGSVYSVSNSTEIFKTEDDPIYRNERTGKSLSYQIPVDNGNYNVNLHFAEIYWNDFNKRIFDVSIEGDLVIDDLDIFANSKNAFFPGKNSALIQGIQDIHVSDGILNIDFNASVNNVSIAGIEVIPLNAPAVIIKQTDGKTEVVEGGSSDTYSVVLNTKPTANVTVTLQKDSQVSVDKLSLTFTPNNWNMPQVVTVSAVDDTVAEGTHVSTINHTVSSSDTAYNKINTSPLSVSIIDNDVVAISFTKKEVAAPKDPTVGTWGPDGRLYVGSYSGTITVYSFDDNYNVTATQTINTIKNLYNAQILGIAFNPFDTSGQPKLYVAHSKLYSNGGDAFPATQLSPYSGQVSVLTGPDFAVAQPLVTGIGVSNHDHGVNGLEFDSQGNLLIAVGGNTNAGIPADKIGGLPESPFTAAILKAEITKPNFNGQIKYTVPAGSVVPTSYPNGYQPPAGQAIGAAEHQVNGGMADVVSGVDVSVYASGLRNSYDLVYTTKGLIYATDNGANKGFGDFSTSATTQSPLNNQGLDELNLIKPGEYYGSPNRNRGRYDDRQNVYYNHNAASIPGKHVAPLTTFSPSTNGIIEYRATTFGSQLRGNLLAQDWNGALFNLTLSADGQQVTKKEQLIGVSDGLDVLTGPGGAIVGIDFSEDAISVATPNDASVTEVTAYDIFPWRAPAVGGQQFILGGANFGNLSNTQVTVGGVAATLTSVSTNRIKGVLPTLNPTGGDLLDIVVTSAGQTSILTDGFLPV
jgi:glucose/arabinose dehydrogenase